MVHILRTKAAKTRVKQPHTQNAYMCARILPRRRPLTPYTRARKCASEPIESNSASRKRNGFFFLGCRYYASRPTELNQFFFQNSAVSASLRSVFHESAVVIGHQSAISAALRNRKQERIKAIDLLSVLQFHFHRQWKFLRFFQTSRHTMNHRRCIPEQESPYISLPRYLRLLN